MPEDRRLDSDRRVSGSQSSCRVAHRQAFLTHIDHIVLGQRAQPLSAKSERTVTRNETPFKDRLFNFDGALWAWTSE